MIGDILQPTHLIFIFVVALLVLGPKRLPEVGRSLGKGIRDFRGAMAGIEDQARDVFDPGPSSSASDSAAAEDAEPVAQTLSAPEPVTVPEPATVSPPAPERVSSAGPADWAATAPSLSASGSGFAEPDPDEYTD